MRVSELARELAALRERVRSHERASGRPMAAPLTLARYEGRAVVERVVDGLPDPTLRDALFDDALHDVIAALPARVRRRVLDQLTDAVVLALAVQPVSRGATAATATAAELVSRAEPGTSAASPQRPELPPEGRVEAHRWAVERGLAHVLERPLSMVPGSPPALAWVLASDVLLPSKRRLPGELEGAGRAALRAHLHGLVERADAARASRAALRFDAPLSPTVERLVASIKPAQPSKRWLPYPTSTVEVQHDPPAARVDLVGVNGETGEVLVSLHGDGVDELRPRVGRGGWGDVPGTERAALDVFVDALREPALPAGVALRELLGAPSWRRALQAYERLRPRRDVDARLAFRASSTGAVSALIQRRRASGGWGVGSVARLPDAEAAATTSLERRIVTLLGLRARDDGATWLELLRALGGHPRVFAGASGTTPLRVVEADPVLEIVASGGDRSLALRLGDGPRVPLVALPIAVGVVASLSDAPATLRFAELPDEIVALASAARLAPGGFPADADELLVEVASSLQAAVAVELPEELAGARVAAAPTLVARGVLSASGELDLSLLVRPAPDAAPVEPGRGPVRAFFGAGGARAHVVRELDDEVALAAPVWERLALPMAGSRGRFHATVPSSRVLDAALDLSDAGVPIELPEGELPRAVARVERASLRARVTDAGGYFSIGGDAEVDEGRVALDALLAAAREGRRFVEIAPGRFATLSAELRDDLARLADVVEPDGALTLAAMPVVDQLFSDEELGAAAAWRDVRARMRAARDVDVSVPAGLTAELRDYQREGFAWMARLAAWGAGGCLADDMGLGKTVQTLALLLHRAPLGPALVIAPTSVVDNWAAEAAKFAPSLDVVVLRGQGRGEALAALGPGSVALISYDVAVRDLDALQEIELATLVLDEAQAVKNPDSKRARAVATLSAGAKFALSGTPIENHLGELWSLYRIVLPGLFGSLERFRARFSLAIERDRDVARKQALAELLRPFLLRRTKESVAPELPPRTEVTRFVELGRRERARYEAERRDALAELERLDPAKGRVKLLARLTRLRRLACDVRLVDARAEAESSKLASTLELLDEIVDAGHTALVFSQFTSHLALLRAVLDGRGQGYAYLDGATPAASRAAEVARFQAGGARLFLLSLKAGGTGLNLTAADYVLHLDPWWNPAAEDQATDRAHRIGQDKPVTVVRLVTKGTIEEAVLALHDEKRGLARAVLEGADAAGKLSARELIDLVR